MAGRDDQRPDKNKYNLTLDPTSFVRSAAYGISPSNTTLTISYIVGGGIGSNTGVDTITTIGSLTIDELQNYVSSQTNLLNVVKSSIKVNNPTPTVGGDDEESVYMIRQNAISNFTAQDRLVTKEDYISTVFNMPAEYGFVAKAFVTTESDLNMANASYVKGLLDSSGNLTVDSTQQGFRKINMDGNNQFGINLYLLTYDENKNLTPINDALSYNVKSYLSKYRVLSDRINIIDGFIINIGVNFSILTYSNYNKMEVLTNCINVVKSFFDIEMWQFSQPINLGQLQLDIANIEGVQSIANLEIINLTMNNGNYSIYEYDIVSATRNNIIYPPIDPTIFEVKYLDTDIQASVI